MEKRKEFEKKPVIFVDHREMKCSVYKHLKECEAIIEPKSLTVGDYICSERVACERKRIEDFLESMINQRIFNQLKNLSESYEIPVLILEGNPDMLFYERRIHANAIRGMLSTIAIDFRIPIIWTRNPKETASQIFWIANREQVLERRDIRIRSNKKNQSIKQQQEFLISGLPFVNTKLSRRLLEKFKTPKRVFSAKQDKFIRVDGLGNEKSRKIFELLNKEYEKG